MIWTVGMRVFRAVLLALRRGGVSKMLYVLGRVDIPGMGFIGVLDSFFSISSRNWGCRKGKVSVRFELGEERFI